MMHQHRRHEDDIKTFILPDIFFKGAICLPRVNRHAQVTPQRARAVAHAMPDGGGQHRLHLQLFNEKRFRRTVGQNGHVITQRAQLPRKRAEVFKPVAFAVAQCVFNNQPAHEKIGKLGKQKAEINFYFPFS